MTTTGVDLARRLANARLKSGELRWPELSMACDCDKGVIHLWDSMTLMPLGDRPCSDCHGTGRVPNVTLETMLVVVMGGGFHADFFTNAGDGRVWLTVSPVIPPRNKPRWHFTWTDQGYSGTDAKAALMAAMGVWRTVLEEAP